MENLVDEDILPNQLWKLLVSWNNDHVDEVFQCIEESPEFCRAVYKNRLPLHEAIICKNFINEDIISHIKFVNLISVIVQSYPEACQYEYQVFVDMDEYECNLALQDAIIHCVCGEVLNIIISAFPAAMNHKDYFGNTPLSLALHQPSMPMDAIESLLNADPKAIATTSTDNLLPIHVAMFNDHSPEMLALLIERYPHACKVIDMDGNTMLALALKKQCTAMVISLIIKYYPEALMIQNADGNLPLHTSLQSGSEIADIQLLLITAWPDACKVFNHNHEYPLQIAVKCVLEISIICKLISVCPEVVHYDIPGRGIMMEVIRDSTFWMHRTAKDDRYRLHLFRKLFNACPHLLLQTYHICEYQRLNWLFNQPLVLSIMKIKLKQSEKPCTYIQRFLYGLLDITCVERFKVNTGEGFDLLRHLLSYV